MRWTPGPISPNIEDRRFEGNTEQKLRALQDAIRRGTLADPGGAGELPPWMWNQPTTQETVIQQALSQLFGTQGQQNAAAGTATPQTSPNYLMQLIHHAFGLGGQQT